MNYTDKVGPCSSDQLVLGTGQLHVWKVCLSQPPVVVERLRNTLSPVEQESAERFAFADDRRRFTVARGALRTLIGAYLSRDPASIEILTSSAGKPYVASTCGAEPIYFNLSHSHELALCAFALGGEVGVDLEHVRAVPDLEAVAQSVFSHREYAALLATASDRKLMAFLSNWVRKEAYVKALGVGLSVDVRAVEVGSGLHEAGSLGIGEMEDQDSRNWTIFDVCPGEEYVAAIAAEGASWAIAHLTWNQHLLD